MASIDELSGLITSDIQQTNEVHASIDGSKSHADELASQFQGLNADAHASGAEQVKQILEEAQAIIASGKSKLEEAQSHATSLKGLIASDTGSARASPSETPARQATQDPQIGDKIKAVEEVNSDEDASPLTRLLRKSGDVKDATSTTSDAVHNLYNALKGPQPTHTGTVDNGPHYQEQEHSVGNPDPMLSMAMGALVWARAIQLHRKKRKNDD